MEIIRRRKVIQLSLSLQKKKTHNSINIRYKNLFQENDFTSCAQSTLVVDDLFFLLRSLSLLLLLLPTIGNGVRMEWIREQDARIPKESHTLDIKFVQMVMTKMQMKRYNWFVNEEKRRTKIFRMEIIWIFIHTWVTLKMVNEKAFFSTEFMEKKFLLCNC